MNLEKAEKIVNDLDNMAGQARNEAWIFDDLFYDLITKAKNILSDEIKLYKMFRAIELTPRMTNLPVIVWCSRELKNCAPFIKVDLQGWKHLPYVGYQNAVTLTISDNPQVTDGELEPEIFEQIKRWIKLNKKALMKYWNRKATGANPFKFINVLKKI